MKFGFPLVLASRISLAAPTANNAAGRIPFDSAKLQTPNREAFAIHELRFFCDQDANVGPNNYNPDFNTDAGGFLRVTLRIGPYDICSNLPLWALSSSRDQVLEGAAWRLPLARPLFVPPGMAFIASAERVSQTVAAVARSEPKPFVGAAANLTTTLVGRTVVADFPRTTAVPYINAYAPDAIAAGGSCFSTEQDLANQLDKDLEARYALGRIGHLRRTGGAPRELYAFDCTDVRLSMISTLGYKNRPIFQNAEFNVAFDPCTRVLNLGGLTVGSGDRLVFRSEIPTYTRTTPDAWLPVVSLVADRKEAV